MSYSLALSASQRRPFGEGTSSGDRWEFKMKDLSFSDEEMGECRICHEEELVNKLEAPCACNGSIKPYQGGYTVPDHKPEDTRINISEIEDLYDSGASRERLLEFGTAQNLLRNDPDDESVTASRIRNSSIPSNCFILFTSDGLERCLIQGGSELWTWKKWALATLTARRRAQQRLDQ